MCVFVHLCKCTYVEAIAWELLQEKIGNGFRMLLQFFLKLVLVSFFVCVFTCESVSKWISNAK